MDEDAAAFIEGCNIRSSPVLQVDDILLYGPDLGPEKVDELTHHVGSMSFDPAIQRVLGVSADQFYEDWVAFLFENYRRLESEIGSRGYF